MNRRWLYWGVPIIGALLGVVHVVIRLRRHDDALDTLDEAIDCFSGAVIWLAVTSGLSILLLVRRLLF